METVIKATYIEPSSKLVHSKIFTSMVEAIPFVKGKQNVLLLQLSAQNGNQTDWEVLPFGDYKAYKISMFVKNNLLEISLLLVAIGFAVSYNLKKKGIKLFVREQQKAIAPAATEPVVDTEPKPSVEPSAKTE